MDLHFRPMIGRVQSRQRLGALPAPGLARRDFPMQPLDHLGWSEPGGAPTVLCHLVVAEKLAPGSRGAPAEESSRVGDDLRRGWDEDVRAVPHPPEGCGTGEYGPGPLRDGYPQPPGESAHLCLEVREQIVVV